MSLPPRCAVTPAEIDAVVAAVHTAVRQHPVPGPVFARPVGNGQAHEEKIARFWRNAIWFERG
jgi:hemoglobin